MPTYNVSLDAEEIKSVLVDYISKAKKIANLDSSDVELYENEDEEVIAVVRLKDEYIDDLIKSDDEEEEDAEEDLAVRTRTF